MIVASRRSMDNQLMQIRLCEPSDWPNHLRQALEIVEKGKSLDEAKAILVESVKAAHACAQAISQIQLSNGRINASEQFHRSCIRIANCLKPTRSLKEMRNALNEVARDTFGRGVDTESISDFFCGCDETLKKRVHDKTSDEILKYLGHVNNSRFGQLEDKEFGLPTLAIVEWYDSLPSKLMLNMEFKLHQIVEERQLQLTAGDIFQALSDVISEQNRPDVRGAVKDLRSAYVQEIEKIWKKAGLKAGRTTNAYDPVDLGPFPNFAERVLLSQFDAKYNHFHRPGEEQVWAIYEALLKEFEYREASIDPREEPSPRLIPDRLLRQALKAPSKKME